MAYLDGKLVDDKEIDPAKHKFIGMFRPPDTDYLVGKGFILCACRRTIQSVEGIFDHWQMGHFDEPQYESIPILDPKIPVNEKTTQTIDEPDDKIDMSKVGCINSYSNIG